MIRTENTFHPIIFNVIQIFNVSVLLSEGKSTFVFFALFRCYLNVIPITLTGIFWGKIFYYEYVLNFWNLLNSLEKYIFISIYLVGPKSLSMVVLSANFLCYYTFE